MQSMHGCIDVCRLRARICRYVFCMHAGMDVGMYKSILYMCMSICIHV